MSRRTIRMPRSVKRIDLIDSDGDARTLYRSERRSQSTALKPFERMSREMARSMKRGAEEYLRRHEESNAEERDGWLTDLGGNVYRANVEAMRQARRAMPFAYDDEDED